VALQIFLEFGNTDRPEGTLIQTSLKFLQLKVGISCPILQANFDQWGSLATSCRMLSLWSFIHKAKVTVSSTKSYVPQLQQQGNRFLMDLVGTFNLPWSDLAAFNRCHLAQWVSFLSDIVDGWGHSLYGPIIQPLLCPPQSFLQWL